MLASKDFGRAASGHKGGFEGLRGFEDCSGSTTFAALPDRRLLLTPEIKALFGVSAGLRMVFSINEKVCDGAGHRIPPSGRGGGTQDDQANVPVDGERPAVPPPIRGRTL